ncbi:MAG: 7-cyano-7-deazaguanine synthase [Sedimentisphaerales bacterium]|nr:7-cyano-7-deazaguanine synthase [Sedimentisphaerales bacterium]
MAYAIASAHGEDSLAVYENGVTSINLHRREDLMNARASRTTHPQTIGRLASLYSLVGEKPFQIKLPYLDLTKAEVIRRLRSKSPELIASSVSCTKTFNITGEASHCGYCFQCIDRRIAAFAAEAENEDHRGLYDHDIIGDPVDDSEARTTLVDYLRQATRLADQSVDAFASEYLLDLGNLLDYLPTGLTDSDKTTLVWRLCQRHGLHVKNAINRMRSLYDDVYKPIPRTSLLGLISGREHLRPEVIRLCESILHHIDPFLGDMFGQNKPKDENDLNSKLAALLGPHEAKLRREHPTVSFACARVVPDHLDLCSGLLIEAKYIRSNTPPSRANEGIAADLTKYPARSFILFVVYDPFHKIDNDVVFCSDIERKGRNRVIIVR